MKQTITKLLGSALFALFLVPSVAKATITATWDWATNNPSGITELATIQNGTSTITSSNGVILFVDATASGAALRSQSGNAQFNSGTKLHVPVVSTNDVVSFVPNSYGYTGVKIGNEDFDETVVTRTHKATPEEVSNGYVVIESKGGYVNTVSVELAYMPLATPYTTIIWDWQNDAPSGICSTAKIEGNTGNISSTMSGIDLYVDATNGKLQSNSGNAQFNTNTILRVPVTSTDDVITVVPNSYNWASGYTIGGDTYSECATMVYHVKAADVTAGHVDIVSLANLYINSVTLTKPSFTTATIGTYQWATFSNTLATDFSNLAGVVDAYQVKGNEGTAITKESVTTAAGSTGLLLNGEAGTYSIPLAATGTDLSSTNKLVAVTSATTVNAAESGYTNYVLSVADSKAVFKYIDDTSANVEAGKAYLKLTGSPASAPSFLSLDFDSETTDLSEKVIVKSEKFASAPVYNLNGQRVMNPSKGLYIVNGKKVVLK